MNSRGFRAVHGTVLDDQGFYDTTIFNLCRWQGRGDFNPDNHSPLRKNLYGATSDDYMRSRPCRRFPDNLRTHRWSLSTREHRLGLLLDYVQKEAPGWAPGLRDAIHAPMNWTRNGLASAGRTFGFGGDGDSDDEEGLLSPIVRQFLQPPSPGARQAFWMTPDYHHKGFLPIDDAMVMKFNFRQHAFSDRVQLDFSPFYGQNLMSLNGYGGAEIGINLNRSGAKEPWGRIAVRYTQGDQDLMDQGHGIDMHAELRFTDRLSLNAGVRENEETQLGNYVLLRWHITDFGK